MFRSRFLHPQTKAAGSPAPAAGTACVKPKPTKPSHSLVVGKDIPPEFVSMAIMRQYQRVANTTYDSNNGEKSDYDFCRRNKAPDITLSSTVAFLLTNLKRTTALKVLDIGAGNACALLNLAELHKDQVELTAISGSDYYKGRASPSAIKYLVMDAHQIQNNAVTRNEKFNLIISFNTFKHLADSIKVLIDAYQSLEPGGYLIIDELPIHGVNAHQCYILLNHLRENGFKVTAFVEEHIGQDTNNRPYNSGSGQFTRLIIEKTKPSLSIPLVYMQGTNDTNPILYKLALNNLDQHCINTLNYRMYISYHSPDSKHSRTSEIHTSKIRILAKPKSYVIEIQEIGKADFDKDVNQFFNPKLIQTNAIQPQIHQSRKWQTQHLPDPKDKNLESARKKRAHLLLAAGIGFYAQDDLNALARVDRATKQMVVVSRNTMK